LTRSSVPQPLASHSNVAQSRSNVISSGSLKLDTETDRWMNTAYECVFRANIRDS
jgi:hypothetical protein